MKKVPTTKTKSQTPKQIKTFYKLESTFPSFITSLRHDYTKNLTQQKKNECLNNCCMQQTQVAS